MGGGITREVAQCPHANGFAWRLSIADIETEGAFSIFAGMSRILTVIDGDGLVLHHRGGDIEVPFCVPTGFSGDTEIRSELRSGTIRDFNVIFDPTVVAAEVKVLDGPTTKTVTPVKGTIYGVYVLNGHLMCDGVSAEQGVFIQVTQSERVLQIADDSRLLLIRLTDLNLG